MVFECDIPHFKKCCFCIPTRYGLLLWGILKLYVVSMFLIKTFDDYALGNWTLILEICFTILMMAAVIMKNEKLFRIYYISSLVGLALIMVMFGLLQIGLWKNWVTVTDENDVNDILWTALFDSIIIFVFLLEGYVTLLVRSELMLLRAASRPVTDNTATATVEMQSECQDGKCVDV